MWKILNKKIKKNRKTKWIEEISDLHITGLNPTLPIKSESCASTFKKTFQMSRNTIFNQLNSMKLNKINPFPLNYEVKCLVKYYCMV